ncbi:MAG: T9SS type A sorting domain-containing protein [Chitinophagales bacterium]|nr:T9SS type A sorting domain-containing protein [Chitinophagales bacterium]
MNKFNCVLAVLAGLFFINRAKAQTPEWKDVAPIFYHNCATCHREGEIGDKIAHFTSYQSTINSKISGYFYSIPIDVQTGVMPPWKADPHYTQFLDQRLLSPEDKQKLIDWVNADGPAGDTTLAPPSPVFPKGSQLGIPDTTLSMSQAYVVPGDGGDHYQCFVLPTNFNGDKAISAIEFRPGNATVVHHVFLYLITDSTAVAADNATPEYGYPSFGGADYDTFNVHANFLTLYGPGLTPRFFSDNSIVKFPPNSFLLIQIHYAPTFVQQTDSSSVNLFYEKNVNPDSSRISYGHRIGEKFITEPGFYLQANHVLTFHIDYPVDSLSDSLDLSLYAIAPHMHLLGKSMKIWATTGENDSIPLIYIPNWSFNWQMLYSFPFMIKLPVHSHLHAEASYDNTVNNPYNPNSPPVGVHYGESSHDEMFKFFVQYLYYKPGDENLIIDSCWLSENCGYILSDGNLGSVVKSPQFYNLSPNPATDQSEISYFLPTQQNVSLSIYNLTGQLVKAPISNEVTNPGFHKMDLNLNDIATGMYFCVLHVGSKMLTKQLIIQH